jgi:hypothetical protein
MNGRCCVFQPFDKGPYDKRYDDTIAPAIRAAGLEPYRVDRDDVAVIPIETLHKEIRSATVCLADIGARNPNVMYELGFAIASGRDVVIICSNQLSEKFPFDVQHRGIVQYASDSASDFDKLKNDITNRLKALLKRQETQQEMASASPVKSTQGLQPSEVAALAFVMANAASSSDAIGTCTIRLDMEKAGYNRVATQLALTRLTRVGFVEQFEGSDLNGNPIVACRMLAAGEDWLLENQDRLELRRPPTADDL